jgi:hypothetical protein
MAADTDIAYGDKIDRPVFLAIHAEEVRFAEVTSTGGSPTMRVRAEAIEVDDAATNSPRLNLNAIEPQLMLDE